MYSIQRLLTIQGVTPGADEVAFFDPREGDQGTVLLSLAEWAALGQPTCITTKIEPGDTRAAADSFRLDI